MHHENTGNPLDICSDVRILVSFWFFRLTVITKFEKISNIHVVILHSEQLVALLLSNIFLYLAFKSFKSGVEHFYLPYLHLYTPTTLPYPSILHLHILVEVT